MNDKASSVFVLLARAGDEISREADAWYAYLPVSSQATVVGFGSISDAITDAAAAASAGEESAPPLKVKVSEGTRLDRDDVLALIEANPWPRHIFAEDGEDVHGGPEDLDLSACDMDGIDLSRDTIRRKRQSYVESTGTEPPWYVPVTGSMRLASANLDHAAFREASLGGVDFTLASLRGTIFAGADIRGGTMQEANLQEVFLMGARLDGVSFRHSDMRNAFLHDARLCGADFRGTNLEGVDMFRVDSVSGARFSGALLNRTRIRRDILGKAIGDERAAKGFSSWPADPLSRQTFQEAKEAYLLLKTNFLEIGRYEDAAWAYIKEQQMEKASYFPTTSGHVWMRRTTLHTMRKLYRLIPPLPRPLFRLSCRLVASLHHFRLLAGISPASVRASLSNQRYVWGAHENLDRPRWLRNWAYEALTGYGERPLNSLVAGSLTMLAFALGYFFSGAIGNFWDALVYSFATFATFNLADLQPHGRGVDIASSVEALLGIAVLALVVFTLGNRMSRS